jgi:photosystem II stability/assembly factor-like uncharacterized protein
VTAILTDPKRPGVVYAGTDEAGLYRSSDGGVTWKSLQGALPAALPALEINSLAAGPSSIYVASYPGLYESRDGGKSWALLLNAQYDGRAVAADPVRGTLLVLLDNFGLNPFVKRSTDGGKHWSSLNIREPLSLAADAGASGRFYVGAAEGVYRSSDGGATWKLVGPQDLDGFRLRALAVDPVTHTVYAGGRSQEVFASTDQGTTWRRSTLSGGFGVSALAARAGVVYAGAATYDGGCCVNGFFVSTNGGANWRRSLEGIGNAAGINALAIDPRKPRTVYIGADSWGVFKSTDAMSHWTLANKGLRGMGITRIALDPLHPRTIWAGSDRAGLWRSADGGKTWSSINAALGTVKALALDPQDPATVFAANSRALLRTSDGGAHWTALTAGLEGAVFSGSLLVDPQRPETVYAGTLQGVFHSGDGGATWSPPASPPECTRPQSLAASPTGVVFQAGSTVSGCSPSQGEKGGLWASTDGGASWEDRTPDLSRFLLAVAVDSAAPSTVYVSGSTSSLGSTLSRSTDGGASWEPITFNGGPVSHLTLGAGHPAAVYASAGSRAYVSRDRGASWEQLLGGESSLYLIDDLAFDPAGGLLYAATQIGLYSWVKE